MPRFESDGASVHYDVSGNGPPVLLIPGIASDGVSWTPLIPLLEQRFTLIRIDNRGAGRTVAAGELNVTGMVHDCAALIRHLGYDKVAVVGQSLGGIIGQRFAASFPDQVERLVTMTAPDRIGAKGQALFGDLAALYFEMEPRKWFRLLFQWLFSEAFFAAEGAAAVAADAAANYPFRQSPEDFARQVRALVTAPAVDLDRIECPTLAMAAELDLLVPPSAVFAGHRGIRQLATSVIGQAAHAVHWEQPAQVAAALSEFLQTDAGRAESS